MAISKEVYALRRKAYVVIRKRGIDPSCVRIRLIRSTVDQTAVKVRVEDVRGCLMSQFRMEIPMKRPSPLTRDQKIALAASVEREREREQGVVVVCPLVENVLRLYEVRESLYMVSAADFPFGKIEVRS